MNKITLLLPMNGLGERFKNYSNLPKPIIKIHGKEMLFHLLDNLNHEFIEKIIIPYNNILDNYNFQNLINERYSNLDIQFLSLKEKTRGAAETILLALDQLSEVELQNRIITMDCDTFYFEDVLKKYIDSQYKNCIFYFVDESERQIFSYIKVIDGAVLQIKEKEKISNFANCGIFCFESAFLLKKYAEILVKNNIKQKNEFYISGICDIILKEKITINALQVNDFVCVGTPIQLLEYIKGKNND